MNKPFAPFFQLAHRIRERFPTSRPLDVSDFETLGKALDIGGVYALTIPVFSRKVGSVKHQQQLSLQLFVDSLTKLGQAIVSLAASVTIYGSTYHDDDFVVVSLIDDSPTFARIDKVDVSDGSVFFVLSDVPVVGYSRYFYSFICTPCFTVRGRVAVTDLLLCLSPVLN